MRLVGSAIGDGVALCVLEEVVVGVGVDDILLLVDLDAVEGIEVVGSNRTALLVETAGHGNGESSPGGGGKGSTARSIRGLRCPSNISSKGLGKLFPALVPLKSGGTPGICFAKTWAISFWKTFARTTIRATVAATNRAVNYITVSQSMHIDGCGV